MAWLVPQCGRCLLLAKRPLSMRCMPVRLCFPLLPRGCEEGVTSCLFACPALTLSALRSSADRRVGFYGSVQDGKWVPSEEVIAEAYDVPIPGYKTKTCSNLRLWDALPTTELDLQAFNAGDYIQVPRAGRERWSCFSTHLRRVKP